MMYHFDIARLLVIVAGLTLKEFAATGEVVKLRPAGKNFVVTPGTHGAMIRGRTPNELYEGSVQILKGSPYNDAISTRIALDAMTGLGVGRLMLKDLEGTSLVTSAISFFDTSPGLGFEVEPGMNEYTFLAQVKPAAIHVGSNRFLVAA